MAAAATLPAFSEDTKEEDRFTVLPKELVHDIIYLLPTADFFALYRSSKKCKELCLTTPFLKFDFLSNIGAKKRGAKNANKLAHYLELYMAQRGERKTQYLHLRWYVCDRALKLLSYAIRSGVEEVVLELIIDGNEQPRIFLPLSLYTCESLMSLTLNFINKPMVYWDFPPTIPFSNLQFFLLNSIKVNDGSSFGEWISSWQNIMEIRLERVHVVGSINIQSSCLKCFEVVSSEIHNLSISGERLEEVEIVSSEIHNLRISGERLEEVEVDCPTKLCNLSISGERVKCIMVTWKFVTSKDTSLEISAPNLKEFFYSGSCPGSFVLENFMHLKRVSLSLEPTEDKPCISNSLLYSVSSTPQIQLQGRIPKVLYEQNSPTPTLDAKTLLLDVHNLHNDFYPPAIVHLLKGMHNLTTLCICAEETLSFFYLHSLKKPAFDLRYWERKDLKFVHQLEHAEIDILNWGNELELAKYLGKHAKKMKEMIICPRRPLSSKENKEIKKLEKTSNARIVVLMHKCY